MKYLQNIFGSFFFPVLAALFCFSVFSDASFAGPKIPYEPPSGIDIFVPDPEQNPVTDDTGATIGGHLILAEVMLSVINVIKYLLGAVAIAFLVYSGMLLVVAGGSEEQTEKGKKGVTWSILGLVFALISDDIILDVLYGGRGFDAGTTLENPETIRTSIDNGTLLILDALNWAQSIIIMGAVGFIIFSGARIIAALGNEETITKHRTTFIWIAIGIVIILVNGVIIQEVIYPRVLGDDLVVQYSPNATPGIVEAVGIIKFFLRFLGVIAFVAFVYGGARMIFAFGNEDQVGEGRKIITGAAIGIVIILVSFALASSFISGQAGG